MCVNFDSVVPEAQLCTRHSFGTPQNLDIAKPPLYIVRHIVAQGKDSSSVGLYAPCTDIAMMCSLLGYPRHMQSIKPSSCLVDDGVIGLAT